jgi:hypothetical protein
MKPGAVAADCRRSLRTLSVGDPRAAFRKTVGDDGGPKAMSRYRCIHHLAPKCRRSTATIPEMEHATKIGGNFRQSRFRAGMQQLNVSPICLIAIPARAGLNVAEDRSASRNPPVSILLPRNNSAFLTDHAAHSE